MFNRKTCKAVVKSSKNTSKYPFKNLLSFILVCIFKDLKHYIQEIQLKKTNLLNTFLWLLNSSFLYIMKSTLIVWCPVWNFLHKEKNYLTGFNMIYDKLKSSFPMGLCKITSILFKRLVLRGTCNRVFQIISYFSWKSDSRKSKKQEV